MRATPPCVLCLSGLDPTGGAGIAADLVTVSALGGHACPVVTTLTVQDTQNVYASRTTDRGMLLDQVQCLLADCSMDAIKIGLLDDARLITALGKMLQEWPELPLVIDPVLQAGGGFLFGNRRVRAALVQHLLPLAHLLTPNRAELRQLVPAADSQEAAARSLLQAGAGAVLVTGADQSDGPVINTLYQADAEPADYRWERLQGNFHGSGCTLAAAAAVLLARREPLGKAIEQAQEFTWNSLQRAFRPGKGQLIPGRL